MWVSAFPGAVGGRIIHSTADGRRPANKRPEASVAMEHMMRDVPSANHAAQAVAGLLTGGTPTGSCTITFFTDLDRITLMPHVARDWKVNDCTPTFTFYLRRGIR